MQESPRVRISGVEGKEGRAGEFCRVRVRVRGGGESTGGRSGSTEIGTSFREGTIRVKRVKVERRSVRARRRGRGRVVVIIAHLSEFFDSFQLSLSDMNE